MQSDLKVAATCRLAMAAVMRSRCPAQCRNRQVSICSAPDPASQGKRYKYRHDKTMGNCRTERSSLLGLGLWYPSFRSQVLVNQSASIGLYSARTNSK